MQTLSEDTQVEIATERLKADIVGGELSAGSKLRIAELKALYGIGATPLREALSRVTSLGYVTNETRRGYRVAEMSEADLADITRARQIIEIGMLRDSMAARSDAWEIRILETMERLRWAVRKAERTGGLASDQVADAHKSLHVALVNGCDSSRLVAMQELLFDQAFRYRQRMISEVPTGEEFVRKHEELVEVVLKGVVEDATAALADHLQLTLREVYGCYHCAVETATAAQGLSSSI